MTKPDNPGTQERAATTQDEVIDIGHTAGEPELDSFNKEAKK
jgi:hypothetical protein